LYVVKQECTTTNVVKCCFVDSICLPNIVDLPRHSLSMKLDTTYSSDKIGT